MWKRKLMNCRDEMRSNCTGEMSFLRFNKALVSFWSGSVHNLFIEIASAISMYDQVDDRSNLVLIHCVHVQEEYY